MLRLLGLVVRMLVATRKVLAGWVAYGCVLVVLCAAPGPLDELYVATCVALVAVATWLVAVSFVLDRSTTSLLTAAAGGPLRFHLLQATGGVVLAAPLAVAAVVAGRASAGPVEGRSVLVSGALAHVVALLVGAGIGAIAARPVVRDVALSLVVAVTGFVLVTAVPWSSPLAPALNSLDAAGTAAASTGPALLWSVAALAWATILALVGGVVAARRRSYGAGAAE